LWQVDLADPRWDVAEAWAVLDSAERARADRGTTAVRRRRVLLRAGLRRVLAELLCTRPDQVGLTEIGGRPILAGPEPLHFSCTADGDLGLIAVARGGPLGVDVQAIGGETVERAVAEGWLTDAERAAVAGFRADDRAAAVTRCWAQKEAVLKAEGVGLSRCPASVLTPVRDCGRIGPWWLVPVPVGPDRVACLAASSRLPLRPLRPVWLLPGGRP
jgi:phosphopantetheinyl transferase